MKFTLTIDCDNAAFEDEPWFEIARILRDAANRVPQVEPGDTITLRDINGNKVGYMALEGDDA